MNRENRRALKKKLRNVKSRTLAADILGSLGEDVNTVIRDGDRVLLNLERIIGRKDYAQKQEAYRELIESSRGKVFTAHSYHPRPDGFSALLTLEGVDNWLFWYGDLIPLKDLQVEEDE